MGLRRHFGLLTVSHVDGYVINAHDPCTPSMHLHIIHAHAHAHDCRHGDNDVFSTKSLVPPDTPRSRFRRANKRSSHVGKLEASTCTDVVARK